MAADFARAAEIGVDKRIKMWYNVGTTKER